MRSPFQNKNEFSWSLSRFTLFNFCKKAYCFHYYASWGGWLDDATPFQKLVYRLKQIKTEKEWIDELILEAIEKSIRQEIDLNIQSIKSYCFRKAYAELSSLQNREFLKDPKKLSLFSHYYGKDSVFSIQNRISERMNEIFESLSYQKLDFLLHKKFLDFISINELVKFNLGQIPIWCKPSFIYHEAEEIIVENFRFNDFRNDSTWPLSSAISLIFSLKSLLRLNKKFQSKTTFIYDKNLLPVYAALNVTETAEIILNSAQLMLSSLDAERETIEINFQACSEKEKCRECNFKEACAAGI